MLYMLIVNSDDSKKVNRERKANFSAGISMRLVAT